MESLVPADGCRGHADARPARGPGTGFRGPRCGLTRGLGAGFRAGLGAGFHAGLGAGFRAGGGTGFRAGGGGRGTRPDAHGKASG
ncbi:hypothetical protein QF032_003319 [Streptomyces achromogenes]|nr:hypothetical protein [Streptomyces achromogenes]